MKTYYVGAGVIFILIYAVFHFGFRKGGAERLYRINDELVFEVQPETEHFNGIAVHGYRRTNKFVCFICGEYEPDDSRVWMTNAKYRSGDFVYSDFPKHEQAKTDIVNLRTGEIIEANAPKDFKYGDDFSKLPEYQTRNLTAKAENKLTQDYIKANFQPLSSYTNRCVYAHVIFVILALFLAFPQLFIRAIDAFVEANDPTRPENYYRAGD